MATRRNAQCSFNKCIVGGEAGTTLDDLFLVRRYRIHQLGSAYQVWFCLRAGLANCWSRVGGFWPKEFHYVYLLRVLRVSVTRIVRIGSTPWVTVLSLVRGPIQRSGGSNGCSHARNKCNGRDAITDGDVWNIITDITDVAICSRHWKVWSFSLCMLLLLFLFVVPWRG